MAALPAHLAVAAVGCQQILDSPTWQRPALTRSCWTSAAQGGQLITSAILPDAVGLQLEATLSMS